MSKQIMINEAEAAKMTIVAELTAYLASGRAANTEKFADLIDSLAYYNNLLVKLGAGPDGK